MLVKFYGIYDSKGNHYAGIRPYTDDVSAVRDFELMVNTKNDNNLVSRYPEDFSLWFLFDLDDVTGLPYIDKKIALIDDCFNKRKVIEASSLVKDK